jgi:hypothetical protein
VGREAEMATPAITQVVKFPVSSERLFWTPWRAYLGVR